MKPQRIVSPRLPAQTDQAQLPRDDLVDEALLSELTVDHVDLSGRSGRLVEIDGCRMTDTNLSGSHLDRLSITDSVLERCDLANAELTHASLSRVEVVGSRMTGLFAPEISLRQVVFRDCLADLSSFRFAACRGVAFVDCRLQRADFASADVTGVVFRRCDLTEVDLSQVKASKAVFVECTWQGIRGITSLAGATIAHGSPIDALTFTAAMAEGLGITLDDPGEFQEA